MTPEFAARIESHRDRLTAFFKKEAQGVLRFESPEDLYQAVQLRALEGARNFSEQGEEAFLGWLFTLARRTTADRSDYWRAMKRDCGGLLRLSWSSGSHARGESKLAGSAPGPATWASQRELLILATRALAVLGERDRTFIKAELAGPSLAELAKQYDLSVDAARKVKDRALERLRKTFQILNSRQP